jgi:non-specific serine/threonine protein kinase
MLATGPSCHADAGDDRVSRLPAAAAEFVGRRRELAEGKRLLDVSRLLTLTGAAGIGKTRLAVELARGEAAADVWYVELASLRDARAPARALATAVGLAERREPDELAEVLSERAGLVVLDNCEHLIDASAALVSALLTRCPELRILTTSREPLRVPGEVVWQVPGLDLPALDDRPGTRRMRGSDAVTFFARSASRRLPGFAIADPQLATVARICRRLDSNPLAVELAAARIAHLTLEELERRLAGSFQILGALERGSDRHRSLSAAIDWSHELLTEADRALFRRLSVFRGGFDLQAANAVADSSDVLGGLARLVDKSLVVSLTTSGEPRYRLLETLREYGLQRLRESGEAAQVRARHAAWFLAVGERLHSTLHGPQMVAVVERFELEHDNFRAALDWAVRHDATTAARLASALGELWTQRGYLSEGRERLDRCLEAAASAGEPPFALLLAAANLALRQSDFPGCRRYLEQLAAGSRRAGDLSALAHAHDLLGRVAFEEGDLTGADADLAEATRLFYKIGDLNGVARVRWHLNMVAMHRRDLDASGRHLEFLLAVATSVGSPWAVGHAHLALAHLDLERGEQYGAAGHLLQALRLLGAAGDRWAAGIALRLTAAMAVDMGAGENALVLLAAADATDEAIGGRQGPRMSPVIARWKERARQGVPVVAATSARARGLRMTLAEAIGFAVSVAGGDDEARRAPGLTRREAEVAHLMAAGNSDREIGARLGVSIRTVEKHAENVRSKLGVESRTDVAEALSGPLAT